VRDYALLQRLVLQKKSVHVNATVKEENWHYDWDFAAAEQEFQRAIELNPSYATAHQWHAINLGATGQIDAFNGRRRNIWAQVA
jgi:hypothetical protein